MPEPARKLRIVAEPPIDIGALQRADIAARDWASVHVEADRRGAVEIADVRKVRRG
jgi:hypothetical protein